MRLQKARNRVVKGKAYDKWIIVLPPEEVARLGWRSGTELESTVRGAELRLKPAGRA